MGQIDLTAQEYGLVQKILQEQLPEYEVRAFGSRVHGTARQSSDLDLAVITDRPVEILRMVNLKEAFRESDLPFKVDLIDWAETGAAFRRIIEKEYMVVQGGRS